MIELPLNRHIGNDIIAGVFIILGSDDSTGEFTSLTEDQLTRYQQMFSMIEIFITGNAPARSHLTEETGSPK